MHDSPAKHICYLSYPMKRFAFNLAAVPVLFAPLLHAQVASPWETVAPAGSYVYTDLKTAVKDAASCYRLDLTGQDIYKDKKALAKTVTLTNVMAFRLGNNNLSTLPSPFLWLQGVTYFSSKGNPLTTLPDSIGMWSQLRFLELYDTRFDTLPEGVYGCTRLQSISIAGNKDTLCITEGIRAAGKSLTELKIYTTVIDTLPENFSTLSKLNKLVLYKCSLAEIPAPVIALEQLHELWLDSNAITSVPREISLMQNLTYLSLRGNKITHVTSSICFLQNLAVLDLRGNPIAPYEVQCLQALLPTCRVLF